VSVCASPPPPAGAQTVGKGYTTPPSIAYGELYRDVEPTAIFPERETFPDMVPDAWPAAILQEYRAAKEAPGFDLATFVGQHFTGPTPPGPTVNPAPPGRRLLDYVMGLWPILQQDTTSVPPLPIAIAFVLPQRPGRAKITHNKPSIWGVSEKNQPVLRRCRVERFGKAAKPDTPYPQGSDGFRSTASLTVPVGRVPCRHCARKGASCNAWWSVTPITTPSR
jgi:hypothetical protein